MKKPSRIDNFYEIIETLLSGDTPQKFYYKRVLWQYLKDNHSLDVAYSIFRGYIQTIPQFQSYFDGKKRTCYARFYKSFIIFLNFMQVYCNICL